MKSFSDLPETARVAVEPAIFSFVAHNYLSNRRLAVRELMSQGSADVREQVCRLYLSPELVISQWIVEACDGEVGPGQSSGRRRERLKMIADLRWRFPSPDRAMQMEWERLDDFLLPEDQRQAQLRAMHALVPAFFKEPDETSLERLLSHLYSRDWKIRKAVLDALRDAPSRAYETIGPFAISLVTDEHPSVRIAAIELLCVQEAEQTEKLRWMLRFSPYTEISEAATCGGLQ